MSKCASCRMARSSNNNFSMKGTGPKKSVRKRRIIISTVILGCGVFLAFLLVLGASSASQKPLVSVVGGSDQNLQTNSGGGFFNLNPLGTTTDAASGKNLTSEFAQNYVKNVFTVNTQNPSNASGTLRLPAPGTVNNALAKVLSSDLEYPTFTEKDIRVGSDNSTSSKMRYMNAISAVTQRNFGTFKIETTKILSDLFQNNDAEPLAQYTNIIRSEIRDTLALEVPPQFVLWHLQDLNLWQKKLTLFTAVLNFNSDPLKAAVAVQQIKGVLQETASLQDTIQKQYKNLE